MIEQDIAELLKISGCSEMEAAAGLLNVLTKIMAGQAIAARTPVKTFLNLAEAIFTLALMTAYADLTLAEKKDDTIRP